jgi:hypothetical protein
VRQLELPVREHDQAKVLSAGAVLREGRADGRVTDPNHVGGPSGRCEPGRLSPWEYGLHRLHHLVDDPRIPLIACDPQHPRIRRMMIHMTVAQVAAEEVTIRSGLPGAPRVYLEQAVPSVGGMLALAPTKDG